MLDRFRRRSSSGPPIAARRISRREREETQRKVVIIGVGSAAILLAAILIVGAVYQYFYLPGQTPATVGDVNITRGDYWKVRKLELLNQINQYQQFAQLSGQQQGTQYQQLVEQAIAQLETVESDAPNAVTLGRMVDDQVILQSMGEVGITVTDQDVDNFITDAFSPVPLGSPTPTLPIDPTAEAWAAATAEANQGDITPSPSPSPTGTPDLDAARATATATFGRYQDQVLSEAGMNIDDFRRLAARPQIAREKVLSARVAEIPTRAEQVHAAHILVATEELANVIVNQTLKETDFTEVAKQQSADSATAVNGGDLGWFPRGVMAEEFDEVAFSLQPGEVSRPVHTQFGWHIIKVLERQEDRPITSEMLQTPRSQALTKWLDEQKSSMVIEWHTQERPPASPTPTSQFAPPPGAPLTPTPAATAEPSAAP